MPVQTYIVSCRCGTVRIADDGRNDYFSEIRDNRLGPAWACWVCVRYFRTVLIRGRIGRQECGAKCMASKGPSCECKCGGKNHGASYSI